MNMYHFLPANALMCFCPKWENDNASWLLGEGRPANLENKCN